MARQVPGQPASKAAERPDPGARAGAFRDAAGPDTVVLSWTGGWDSTFRLLQLLHHTDAGVQPVYLVDDHRRSTPREIVAMRRIRKMLEARVPDAASRFLPTVYGSFRATTIEPHHRTAWENAKSRERVGRQYPVLASWAEQHGIYGMEVGLEGEPGLPGVPALVAPLVEVRDGPGGPVHVLPPGADDDVTVLLGRFAFPLLNYSKLRMKAEAEGEGWMPVLNETWFCHTPVLGRPCGACRPCEVARTSGFGGRIGRVGPALARIARLKKRLRAFARASLRRPHGP